MTTKNEISEWFDRGVDEGATHMIVVCDTFDYEDYPVLVNPTQNIEEEVVKYNSSEKMSKVMEVYNLGKNKEYQLNQHRAYNL